MGSGMPSPALSVCRGGGGGGAGSDGPVTVSMKAAGSTQGTGR
jgi:hypothetical protein